jgi:hypothetical protein
MRVKWLSRTACFVLKFTRADIIVSEGEIYSKKTE